MVDAQLFTSFFSVLVLNDHVPMLILLEENTSLVLGPYILSVLFDCSLCYMVRFFYPLEILYTQATISHHKKVCMVYQYMLSILIK